jgi:hypothetical protein
MLGLVIRLIIVELKAALVIWSRVRDDHPFQG